MPGSPAISPTRTAAAARAAASLLTKELAHELAKGKHQRKQRCAGLVDTHGADPRLEDEIADTLWPRVGQPEDIANAVAFLASSASDYFTGQVISPNGGA